MTPQQFLNTYQGQSLLFNQADPSLRGECVQAACFYAKANNWPVIWSDAANWWGAPGYTVVAPGDIHPGDLVIWNKNLPNSGGAGHIAIFMGWTSTSTFTSIDQNWQGKYVHQVNHSFDYVLGGIRGRQVGGKGADTQTTQGATTMATIIQDTPNYEARCNKLALQIRGTGITHDEFERNFIGRSYDDIIAGISDSPEADTAFQWQQTGQLATQDNWPGQIYGLLDQVKKYQADLQTAINNQNMTTQQRDTLQAKYDAADKQLQAVTLNNQTLAQNTAAVQENTGLLRRIAQILHIPGF